MLCGTRTSDNLKVLANESTKAQGPFVCPGCNGELIIKKGRIRIHHFSHKPPYNCDRGRGETEAHRRCKESIYQNLLTRANVSYVDIEADLGNVVADVYAVISGVPVAIEVQNSDLSVNEITRRTSEYHKINVNVLWLQLSNEKLYENRYSPKAWEKWCHAAYYGRVYYWLDNLTVMPVHFGEHKLYVQETTWFEPGGYERSEGGYSRTSRRYKTPMIGKTVDIAAHFAPRKKLEWQGGKIYVPNCRIYIDNQSAWWTNK